MSQDRPTTEEIRTARMTPDLEEKARRIQAALPLEQDLLLCAAINEVDALRVRVDDLLRENTRFQQEARDERAFSSGLRALVGRVFGRVRRVRHVDSSRLYVAAEGLLKRDPEAAWETVVVYASAEGDTLPGLFVRPPECFNAVMKDA